MVTYSLFFVTLFLKTENMEHTKPIIFVILLYFSICCFPSENSKQDIDVKKLIEVGYSLYEQERYPEALECYTKSLEKATSSNNYKSQIICIGNIGNIFGIYGDYDRSIYYDKMGFNLAKKNNDYPMQIRFACMLVEISCYNEDVKAAESYYKLLVSIPGKWTDSDKYHWTICQAVIAKAKKKYSESIYLYKKAQTFAIDHKMHNKYIVMIYNELGKIYMSLNQTDKALEEYSHAIELAKKIKSYEMISDTYMLFSDAYKKEGKIAWAERCKALAVQISDSLFNKKQFNYAKNKLFEYEEKQNKEKITILNKRINEQNIIIVLISLCVVMLVVFVIVIIIKNKRLHEAHNLLLDKMAELDRQERKTKELRKDLIKKVNNKENDKGGYIPEDTTESTKTEKRTDIGISKEKETELLDKIIAIMEDIDIISKPDFGLNTLVNMLRSNTSYVSWCINDSFGKNFKTLLNEYRVKEACRRLSDTERYGRLTVQAIYEDLGYKSASNFIKAFKMVIGMTPSQYQKIMAERSTSHIKDIAVYGG